MIRSLVISPKVEPSAVEANQGNSGDTSSLRRNLNRESLKQSLIDGCILWVDLVAPVEEEIRWIENWLLLSPTVIADLLREDRRPTLLVYPRYLFLSLFQPHTHGNTIVSEEIHCIIGDNFYVTVRHTEASALEEAYDRVAQNPDSWHRGVVYFLYLTAQYTIDTYYPLLDRISNQLNKQEEKFLNDSDDKQAQKSVYRTKQHLISLRQMIAPQRQVLSNLMGEPRISSQNDIRDLFRHLYERLLGIYDMIDTLRDLTSNILEIIGNQQSRKIGEAVNRLTIISLIILPFMFFLAVFDAGFFHVSQSIGLPIDGLTLFIVMLVLMVVSIVMMRIFFRHRGWV